MKNKIVIGAVATISLVFIIVLISMLLNGGVKAKLIVYNSYGREVQASSLKSGEIFSANIDINFERATQYKNTVVTVFVPDDVELVEVHKSDIVKEIQQKDEQVTIYLNETFKAPIGLIVRMKMKVSEGGTNYDVLSASVKTERGNNSIVKKTNKERFGTINP